MGDHFLKMSSETEPETKVPLGFGFMRGFPSNLIYFVLMKGVNFKTPRLFVLLHERFSLTGCLHRTVKGESSYSNCQFRIMMSGCFQEGSRKRSDDRTTQMTKN